MGRATEAAVQLEEWEGMARDDWRNKEYWWCEGNYTVHVQKHCDMCQLMTYAEILKRMQGR
jgi:hypothetical protein